MVKAADFVHESNGRFHVARWVESAAQYQWPLSAAERRATGCSGGFSRRVEDAPSYRTRASAMSAARRMFGHVVEDARRESEEDAFYRTPEGRAVVQAMNEEFLREMDAALERDMAREVAS